MHQLESQTIQPGVEPGFEKAVLVCTGLRKNET